MPILVVFTIRTVGLESFTTAAWERVYSTSASLQVLYPIEEFLSKGPAPLPSQLLD